MATGHTSSQMALRDPDIRLMLRVRDGDDTAAFADAIARVLGDPQLAEQLRRSGQGLKSRYSVDAMVDAYVDIIDQACARGAVTTSTAA